MKIERAQFSPRLTSLLASAGKVADVLECDDAEWARMLAHAQRQHPEENEQQTRDRTWYRAATLRKPGTQPEDLSAKLRQMITAGVAVLRDGQKASTTLVLRALHAEQERAQREAEEARRARRNDRRAAALWLCLLTLALLLMLFWPHRAHAQIIPTNTAYIGGVLVDPATYDNTNKAIKVNVVAGGAGGGLAQLQVGRASDGTFVNVGFGASQLNVPVNCVVGCAGGTTTPADTFANPTTAGITVAFPAVWNGATWDRLYGDKTNGAFVNVKALPAISLSAGTAVIGHVIADSGSTTAVTGNVASTVADGANVTLGAKADAKSTATDTTAVSIMSVLKQISASVQAPPSQAVTGTVTANAGTGPFPVGGTATGTATTFLNCDQHFVSNALSTSGNTQIVALTSLQKIYVCGWYVNSASTTVVTAKLVYGTGSSCATGQTDLSIAVPLQLTASTAPAGSNISYGGMIGEQTPASQALCVNLSAAQAVNVEVLYTKF